MVDRKAADGRKAIRTIRVREHQRNRTFVLDGLRENSNGRKAQKLSPLSPPPPTPGLDVAKVKRSHVVAAGRRNDHVVAIVD